MASDSGSTSGPRIDELVLDAGPLVTQQPLQGLARKFYIPPAVVRELRDKRARDHLEGLQQMAEASRDAEMAASGEQDGAGSAARAATPGFQVEIREPGPEAMVAVIDFAKRTGDYAVLSQPDLSVLALTYALEVQRHGKWRLREEVGGKTGQQKHSAQVQEARKHGDRSADPSNKKKATATESSKTRGDADVEATNPARAASSSMTTNVTSQNDAHNTSIHEEKSIAASMDKVALDEHQALNPKDTSHTSEPSDSEDDEEVGGEWITPDNISKHKSRSLGLVTDSDMALATNKSQSKAQARRQTEVIAGDDGWSTVTSKAPAKTLQSQAQSAKKKTASNKPPPKMTVACMTGDYAVQNVLLQIGLSLVGIDGQRIKQVKSWVLRCHACFKICKDAEKTFCPQCGNPTLMRTSVTSTAPEAGGNGSVQVHLKKNFQYKNRGTKYSLPLPKAGKAGGVPGAVPILREDQAEWQRGLARQKVQRKKEDRALQKALERGSDSLSARYEDVDELSVLLAGKASKTAPTMPALGVGRRNPNEKHRRKV